MKIIESKTRHFNIEHSMKENEHVAQVILRNAEFVSVTYSCPLWTRGQRTGTYRTLEIDTDESDRIIDEISRFFTEADKRRVQPIKGKPVGHCVFIDIVYDAEDATPYSHVKLTYPNTSCKVYRTGNVARDYKRALAEARRFGRLFHIPVFPLSSVQNFVFDVPGWRFNEADEIVPDGDQS